MGRKFKPGISGNPKGRPRIREDLKKIELMSGTDVARLLQKMLNMRTQELQGMVDDPDTPAMELVVAKIIHKAMVEGDQARLNFLFDRTIGKVIEKKEVEVKPVIYRTNVRPDGALLQEVIEEEDEGDE